MLIDYKDTGLPSYDIDLEEAPEDRWTGYGGGGAGEPGIFMGAYLRLCFCKAKFAGLFAQEYVKEINGLARAADLPVGYVFLANLRAVPDLSNHDTFLCPCALHVEAEVAWSGRARPRMRGKLGNA